MIVATSGAEAYLGRLPKVAILGAYASLPSTAGLWLMSDEARLLSGAKRFDRQVLAEIHDRFYPEIYRYAAYRLGDTASAEDVAGEVFLRLLAALKEGRGPRSTLRGWLMGTASHLVNDVFRRSYSAFEVELIEDHPADHAGPAEVAERQMQQAAVRDSVRRLTAEQQHVLALRFGSGFSLEETARAMGKSVNAVKSLQLRALLSLRRHLEASGVE